MVVENRRKLIFKAKPVSMPLPAGRQPVVAAEAIHRLSEEINGLIQY
jgi:hypothetical protein